jgi:DNA-binding transcriptional LysR family regulator
MRGSEFNELVAFVAVAEELSFRKGAARLGLMPSTVSHAVRDLEERVGVRLLNRTTRNVAPTEAGERLMAALGPAFTDISAAVDALGDTSGRPSGTVRLSVPRMAATMVLAPAFARFARDCPGVTLEIAVDEGFVDIVAHRFDAGIRLGRSVVRDMVAVRVSPDLRIAIVGSPAYFADHPPPATPDDLRRHLCIGWRQVASGALFRWEFERAGEKMAIPVSGPLVLDDAALMTEAAKAGVGLAYATEATVSEDLRDGRLIRVLEDWCPPHPGFFIYYPSRRQLPSGLRALIDHIRV